MIAKTMTPEQALEWLEGLSNMTGDQVCAEIEDGKAAKAAQVFRDILEAARKDVDLIYLWPDGTWCREEDLEEYLGFMSDDFEVHQVLAYDEHDNPCHTERLSSTPCSKHGR